MKTCSPFFSFVRDFILEKEDQFYISFIHPLPNIALDVEHRGLFQCFHSVSASASQLKWLVGISWSLRISNSFWMTKMNWYASLRSISYVMVLSDTRQTSKQCLLKFGKYNQWTITCRPTSCQTSFFLTTTGFRCLIREYTPDMHYCCFWFQPCSSGRGTNRKMKQTIPPNIYARTRKMIKKIYIVTNNISNIFSTKRRLCFKSVKLFFLKRVLYLQRELPVLFFFSFLIGLLRHLRFFLNI